jgi:hypothetical protein
VNQSFQISFHKKDIALIELIKKLLGAGKITTSHGPDSIQYRVQSIKDLGKILDLFENYPLLTKKICRL